ncbi:MAG: DMT family transporter [Methylocystis sp.]
MNVLAALAAAATGIQVGLAIVATRFVVDQLGPASLALLRYTIGFMCLLPPVLLTARNVRFAARDIPAIALLGITQFGVLIALLNYGLRTVPAGRASLIFALFPFLTMGIAAALGRERLTLVKTIGVLLTIIGVGFALGDKTIAAGTSSWLGEAAVFASAFSGALCSVLYRPYLRKYPTLPISAFAMLASVGFLAILALGEGFFAALPPRLTMGGWAAVVFIGLSSGIGYYLWLWALTHASPTRVTAFLSLSPLTAVMLGAAILGEPISVFVILGLICVGVGLWLAHWPEPTAALT